VRKSLSYIKLGAESGRPKGRSKGRDSFRLRQGYGATGKSLHRYIGSRKANAQRPTFNAQHSSL